jgi:hypothetical protein
MKKQKLSLKATMIAFLMPLVIMALFNACSKTDTTPAVVKTSLASAVAAANTLYGASVEGTSVGKYLAGSKAIFKTAIDAATAINADGSISQTAVDNAVVNLGKASDAFKAAIVTEIALANLVGYWKFNGDAKDASGKGFNGTLKTGSALWGAGIPVLTKDRFGVDNMAYRFDKGGNIEVPYNSALNPQTEMTISVWAKLADAKSSNYMVALNRWNGYKFQFQDAKKGFFTVKSNGKDGKNDFWDADTDSFSADLNKWYHVVVTYKAGEMTFYVNGTLIKTWTKANAGTPIAVKSTINLVFGQDLPTNLYTANEKDDADGNNFNGPWGGYFTGDMDEIRIYNVVLTAAQVKSLNAVEKDQ